MNKYFSSSGCLNVAQKILVFILSFTFWFSGINTFLSLPPVPEAQAAEAVIDSSAQTAGTSHIHAGSQTVFISDQVGYKFYRDASGECVYAKTTNAGSSWGSAVIVDDQGTGTDCIAITVWYDRWTPNNFGNYIHIATLDTGSDDIWYNRLDTTSDTLLTGSTAVSTDNGNVQTDTVTAGANYQSITESTNGTIYVSLDDTSDSFVLRCSSGCNSTSNWSEVGTAPQDLANDYSILVPLTKGDIMIINRDISLEDIRSKIWHNTAGAWDTAWTFIDTNATDNTTYDVGLAAVVASSTSAATTSIYFAYTADNATLGTDDDVRTAYYHGGHWASTTAAVLNSTLGLTGVAISRDTNTGNIYVGYSGRTTVGTAATGNIYWKMSTDKMNTWGSQNGPVNSTANDMYGVDLNLASDQRIYESWFGVTGATISGDTIADLVPGVIVTSSGSQVTSVSAPVTNQYVGGKFVFTEYVNSRDVTAITLTENGTVDAANAVKNVKLYYENDTTAPYDCAGETYNGTEAQFGSTDVNGFSGANGTAAFSGTSAYVATTSALCVYAVMDVNDTAISGDTLNISIANPTTDVTVTGGGEVEPATSVDPTGSTLIYNDAPTQTHFHWRNDNGSETTATSKTGGVQDVNLTSLAQSTPVRLRIGIANKGGTSTPPIQYRLEYSLATSTCDLATGWTDVGATDDAFNMYNSANITDGNNTTNIATSTGGVSDNNTTYLTSNGALKDTSSQTGAIKLSSTNFVDLEYSIVASTSAAQGNTYCFRVTNAGTPLTTYSNYPKATIAADVSVTATSSQIATTSIPSTNVYIGGAYVIKENTSSRNVTSITLSENGTVDASTQISNVKLFYDHDTTAPYDCASESYSGTESQFGSTLTSGFTGPDGTATFTGSASISTTSTLCVYAVMDVKSNAINDQTLNVFLQNPATDIVVSGGGSISPTVPRDITGSTTLKGAILKLSHYHWRKDNGTQATATSQTAGIQDTPISDISQTTPVRLRIEVANKGTVTSQPTALRLEYGTKITTCSAVGTWNTLGTPGGAWNMYNSAYLTDGANTTNIATSTGGVADDNTSFVASNAGVKDTSSQVATTTLTSTQFIETEFSIKQTSGAAYNTTYCFRVSNAGTALNTYSVYPEVTTSPQRDFKVQRGTATLTTASLTLTAGVDYVAPASTSSAFIQITNSANTGAGIDSGGGNQNASNVTTYISNPQNLLTSVNIVRTGTTGNTRVSWEIIEYIGKPGADNEMKVRDQRSLAYVSGGLVATGTAVTGVTDNSKVVVFITGQGNANTGRTLYEAGESTSAWNTASQKPVFTRGTSGAVVTTSYAVVEFTGPNWNIQRVEHTYAAVGTTETQSITAVNSLNRTFIHAQKRVGGTTLNTLADFGHEVWLSSIGAISFYLDSTATSPSSHTSVAWVIENTQITNGAMVVARSNGTTNTAVSPLSLSVSIGRTLSNTNNASIFANVSTAGTGTTFPRALAAFTIASTTDYELWRSYVGVSMGYRVEVVEWPTAGLAYKQKDYRFYVDNDALKPTDPWPAGAADLGEDTTLTATDEPMGDGEHIRIRMSLSILNATLPMQSQSFKLQYGERVTSCSAISESNWNDVGSSTSGTIWRGYDAASVSDDTVLSGNPPTGGDLLLTDSTVAGSYEEKNNTLINQYQGEAQDVIEYDWNVQENGATPETYYCFRMVKSDGSALGGYLNYPQMRTASFSPKSQNWRWYSDVNDETPTVPLTTENSAPTGIANNDALKLRVTVKETKNIARNDVRFKLQYSEYPDFSVAYDVASTSVCTATSTWCYDNAAGTDNAVVSTKVLSDADSCVSGVGDGCGTHNESPNYLTGFRHENGAATEYEFAIKAAAPRVNAVYYFRLFGLAQNIPVVTNSSSSYPSLVIEGAHLVFGVSGLSSGTTTEGVTTNVSSTPTTIQFGSITQDTLYTAAYRLHLTTNATEGYEILMYGDQQLSNEYGIPVPPVDGTNASPVSWTTGCSSTAAGCFGYHAGDDSLSSNSARFAPDDSYAGLSTTPEEIMYSSIPTDDTSDIIFRLDAHQGQAAGTYQTNVSYLAIPVF